MSEESTIYTHQEAANIVELFEDVLTTYGIDIPSPEDEDDRDPETSAHLYGMTYFNLVDEVEKALMSLLDKHQPSTKIVNYTFNGFEPKQHAAAKPDGE